MTSFVSISPLQLSVMGYGFSLRTVSCTYVEFVGLVNPEIASRDFTKLLPYHICPPGVGTVRTGKERGVGPTGGGDDREGR